MRKQSIIALASLGVLAASSAQAQEEPSQTVDEVTAFSTLDRPSDVTMGGVDMGVSFHDPAEELTGVRWDVHAQYVHESKWGGYALIPVSRTFSEVDEETALASIELGGLKTFSLGEPSLTVRAGLALPTADDSLAGMDANYSGVLSRLTDVALIEPDTTWLRLAASPYGRTGQIFYRADAGIDLPLFEDAPASAFGMQDIDPLVRLNLGVGAEMGNVAMMGELATIGTTGDVDGQDRFFHTAAVTASKTDGMIRPQLSLALPLDATVREDVDFILMAGIHTILK